VVGSVAKIILLHFCDVFHWFCKIARFFATEPEIVINHNQDVDISCKINGQKIGFEYEHYNNKNLDIIVQKKEAALKKYDVVRFISSSSDIKMVSKAVGERYSIKREAAVTDFIESLTEIKVALAHPAASNGVCSRHRSKLRKRKQ